MPLPKTFTHMNINALRKEIKWAQAHGHSADVRDMTAALKMKQKAKSKGQARKTKNVRTVKASDIIGGTLSKSKGPLGRRFNW